jgi:hypothetical protein
MKLKPFSRSRVVFAVFAVAALLGSAITVLAQAQNGTIDGKVSGVDGMTLTVAVADGSLKTVRLLPDTLVLARETATLDSIKPHDALGVAARREADGSLTATGINIFPPALWDRVRKGQFPMQSGDIMTNALVTDYVLGVQGHVLRMKYQDVVATINVPDLVPINRIVTERSADLKPGMHVLVRGTTNASGSLDAGSVSFELPPNG